MGADVLSNRVLAIRTGEKKPEIGVLVLPGLIPGPPSPEHDSRIIAGLYASRLCLELGAEVTIITTSGCHDRYGESGANYFLRQNRLFASAMGIDIESRLEIGEDQSCHTANSLRLLRPYFSKRSYDLIVLVSNTPHLWPATVYFRNLNPQVPFVTYSSGDGQGASGGSALNADLERYIAREKRHYFAAMTFDRVLRGRTLDIAGYSRRLRALCRTRQWPPIVFPAAS